MKTIYLLGYQCMPTGWACVYVCRGTEVRVCVCVWAWVCACASVRACAIVHTYVCVHA